MRLTSSDPAFAPFEIIFETDGQKVTSMRSGFSKEVELVKGCV